MPVLSPLVVVVVEILISARRTAVLWVLALSVGALYIQGMRECCNYEGCFHLPAPFPSHPSPPNNKPIRPISLAVAAGHTGAIILILLHSRWCQIKMGPDPCTLRN